MSGRWQSQRLTPAGSADGDRRTVPGDQGGLGGIYLLEAADLDEAISLAALLPEVSEDLSGVEIRLVVHRD